MVPTVAAPKRLRFRTPVQTCRKKYPCHNILPIREEHGRRLEDEGRYEQPMSTMGLAASLTNQFGANAE